MTKLDLAEICPELADPMKEVTEVMLHFKTSPSWQRARNLDELLDKTELTLTFKEVQAIAATMLKLAEENERLKGDNKLLGDQLIIAMASPIKAARKGDPHEKV